MNEKPVVFITGASQGIGAAAAVEFASRGYNVALLARNGAALEQTGALAAQKGAEFLTFPGDVSDLDATQKAVEKTAEKWGRIDCLVNNAAWREVVTMRNISLESWEKTLKICLTAPAFLARWCAAEMEKRAEGVIINVSSIMAAKAGGICPAYTSAKAGLDGLTYELAALYGSAGIRVCSINLGAIDTEMSADYESADGEDLNADIRRFAEDMIPLRRFATAEEAARSIAMLASPDASYLHGANVVVDGGWTHHHFPHSIKKRQSPGEFR